MTELTQWEYDILTDLCLNVDCQCLEGCSQLVDNLLECHEPYLNKIKSEIKKALYEQPDCEYDMCNDCTICIDAFNNSLKSRGIE